jgi:hypothetical protein
LQVQIGVSPQAVSVILLPLYDLGDELFDSIPNLLGGQLLELATRPERFNTAWRGSAQGYLGGGVDSVPP